MANKQIHQLPAANALAPDDQLLVSQAGGNVTRRASLANLPFQPALPGTVDAPSRPSSPRWSPSRISVRSATAPSTTARRSRRPSTSTPRSMSLPEPTGSTASPGQAASPAVRRRPRCHGPGRPRGPGADLPAQRRRLPRRRRRGQRLVPQFALRPAHRHERGRHRFSATSSAPATCCSSAVRPQPASPMPTAGASTWSTPTSASLSASRPAMAAAAATRCAPTASAGARPSPVSTTATAFWPRPRSSWGPATPAACSSRATTRA